MTVNIRPRILSAGNPISTETTPAARPAYNNASGKSPMRLEISYDVTAPIDAIANWPSVSCPPRPVRTPIEMPMMAKAIIPVNVTDMLLDTNAGTKTRKTMQATPTMRPRLRTSQSRCSASGTGRRAWTAAQLPFSSSRPARCRCSISTPRMMTNSVTSTRPDRG